ncbi:hypothetical protein F8M41_026014 [Gigaspora margarita]|uniref:Uncharacterized protein n=1 Tax=Gigaspora margarita TaxID=4874 RepID=A0A8H4AAV9_GIGMA|nr:hypothetical protein F8M41_026014 [Gigaspora margarita]
MFMMHKTIVSVYSRMGTTSLRNIEKLILPQKFPFSKNYLGELPFGTDLFPDKENNHLITASSKLLDKPVIPYESSGAGL